LKILGKVIGTGIIGIGSGFAIAGKGAYKLTLGVGKWFLTGFKTMGNGFKEFFAKLTHQKEKAEQVEALAKVLAAKKVSKSMITKTVEVQPVQIQQPEIIKIEPVQVQPEIIKIPEPVQVQPEIIKIPEPQSTVEVQPVQIQQPKISNVVNAKEDPLEVLRKKYGR